MQPWAKHAIPNIRVSASVDVWGREFNPCRWQKNSHIINNQRLSLSECRFRVLVPYYWHIMFAYHSNLHLVQRLRSNSYTNFSFLQSGNVFDLNFDADRRHLSTIGLNIIACVHSKTTDIRVLNNNSETELISHSLLTK